MLISELIKLNNLPLAAKLLSEEVLLGTHGSKRLGMGTEFEQYRHYQVGDDTKRIDWKLFARTEKHLIRESSTESNFHVRLLIDLSGSMNYSEKNVSRLAYAKILLASLAYIAFRQNDKMSLYGLQDNQATLLVPNGKQAFQRILYELEKTEAKGSWTNKDWQFPEFQQKEKELIIFVSDLLEINEEWLSFIKNLANPSREIIIYQLLGENELAFNLKGFYRFQDLETGKEMELEAESVKEIYLKNVENYLKNLDLALQIPFVYLNRVQLNMPIANVISESLKKRKN